MYNSMCLWSSSLGIHIHTIGVPFFPMDKSFQFSPTLYEIKMNTVQNQQNNSLECFTYRIPETWFL